MTSLIRCTGEQNEDLGFSHIARDWKDTNAVREFFLERNPFEHGAVLCNIADGVHAQASVNVDDAKEVGEMIVAGMEGKSLSELHLNKAGYMAIQSRTVGQGP